MNAMRAAVLPRHSAEDTVNAQNTAPLRPKLRVVHRAESSQSVLPVPAVPLPADFDARLAKITYK